MAGLGSRSAQGGLGVDGSGVRKEIATRDSDGGECEGVYQMRPGCCLQARRNEWAVSNPCAAEAFGLIGASYRARLLVSPALNPAFFLSSCFDFLLQLEGVGAGRP